MEIKLKWTWRPIIKSKKRVSDVIPIAT